jgi:hypothetical protein
MAARGGHGPHSCILLGLWEMVSTDSFHLALSTDDLVADPNCDMRPLTRYLKGLGKSHPPNTVKAVSV